MANLTGRIVGVNMAGGWQDYESLTNTTGIPGR